MISKFSRFPALTNIFSPMGNEKRLTPSLRTLSTGLRKYHITMIDSLTLDLEKKEFRINQEHSQFIFIFLCCRVSWQNN